jgi:hypothetical protein
MRRRRRRKDKRTLRCGGLKSGNRGRGDGAGGGGIDESNLGSS